MNRTKPIQGECQHCGGRLSFPADNIGSTAACPHCGQQTELRLMAPPEEPTIPRRAIVWSIVAAVILVLGLVGALVALKRAESLATRHRHAAPATNSPPLP